MATIKKYNGSTWENAVVRKYGTSTDTLTTLPADLYADGNNATVGLMGNMSQTGTPTPQNPIFPTECGELETSGTHSGQYKVPILSNSTTTPVYLGEVESTRQIVKLVLNGTESWDKYSSTADSYLYYLTGLSRADVSDCICTHTPYSSTVPNGSGAGVRISDSRTVLLLNCGYMSIQNNTKEDFKAWLAQQYANGTPVTVWYVLATPTTGIVNEPIRKIGDYADSVTATNIPTTAGGNEFDVLTTLKPSEVSLTYTGWHDASVKEWDGSEWQ